MIWEIEHDNELKSLIAAGKSYREIADTFGVTRCAIAGRCRRIGLSVVKPVGYIPINAAELETLWRAGMTIDNIAERFNSSANKIKYWAGKLKLGPHPLATRHQTEPVSEAEVDKIISMRRAGKTWRDVSRSVGRAISTCHQVANGRAYFAPLDDAEDVSVPAERIAERRARLSAPARDLTAILLGDPPVGYSALEKK